MRRPSSLFQTSRATVKAIARASLLPLLFLLATQTQLLASPAAPPAGAPATAPTAITYDNATRTFRLDGGDVTYVFGINERNELQSLYWGHRLAASDRLPSAHSSPEQASFDTSNTTTLQEFAGWGAELYVEPALKVTFSDGNRDLVLHYVSHTIAANTLTIVLRDISRDLFVALRYSMDKDTGILGRSATIENRTQAGLTIEQAAAASWNLPRGTDYTMHYLSGRWAGESALHTQPIQPGKTVLESRRGSTGHQNNPWFAINRGPATEQTGDVWFGALAWSGSWSITLEQDQLQQIRVTGGFNPFDFAYPLAPGQKLETPVFYAGYSNAGMGEASRLLHRFELAQIIPHAPNQLPRPRPVLYNSWEATEFNVDEAGQTALAEKAASIGVERFVMDDGWFGQRKDDHAGLGDWYVNPQKFPNGLAPLIKKVHSLGMDFGLWFEPEMVNPDSDLYRKHPDWVIHFPGRPETQARNQLVLNLAMPEVRAYVFGFLDKTLTDYDIAFVKWDYNRNWSEPGWSATKLEDQKTLPVAYIHNLYSILSELRAKHPRVEFESCSGGGGRIDLGILGLTEEVWTSDNTDPFDRLLIQDGFTHAYTPGVMMAWVTDSSTTGRNHRNFSTAYRFLSSMQGGLGIGSNLNKWTPDDFATAKHMVAEYKAIRDTVQHGSLYRLVSPQGGSEFSATQSVSLDRKQSVAFAFLHSSQMGYPVPRLYLQGLNPTAIYRTHIIHGSLARDTPASASGAFWISHGLDIDLQGDYDAAAVVFEQQ
jgi:alpha-galactosidase